MPRVFDENLYRISAEALYLRKRWINPVMRLLAAWKCPRALSRRMGGEPTGVIYSVARSMRHQTAGLRTRRFQE